MAKVALKGCKSSTLGCNFDSSKYKYVSSIGIDGAYDTILTMRFLYQNVGTLI